MQANCNKLNGKCEHEPYRSIANIAPSVNTLPQSLANLRIPSPRANNIDEKPSFVYLR